MGEVCLKAFECVNERGKPMRFVCGQCESFVRYDCKGPSLGVCRKRHGLPVRISPYVREVRFLRSACRKFRAKEDFDGRD